MSQKSSTGLVSLKGSNTSGYCDSLVAKEKRDERMMTFLTYSVTSPKRYIEFA
jgi:hypothetical protein